MLRRCPNGKRDAVYVECEVCKGKRYNKETLEVSYKGKNISDVLEMSVGEAYEFFDAILKEVEDYTGRGY